MPMVEVSQESVCGCSTHFIIFAVGAASLGVSIWSYMEQGGVNCGENGKPPLLEWILGTGISYLIIAMAYTSVSGGHGTQCSMFVVGVSNTFIFAWMVVGAISLWRDGTDCEQVNIIVWKMGLSAVILSIILCCCGGFEMRDVYTGEGMGRNQNEEVGRNQNEEVGRNKDEEVGRNQELR